MLSYNPSNWYWFVGADRTKVFSSKVGDYVSVNDSTYKAWVAFGCKTVEIKTEAELGEILSQSSGARPVPAAILDAFKDNQLQRPPVEVVMKMLFDHENRLRALEGKPSFTANQLRQALKAMV